MTAKLDLTPSWEKIERAERKLANVEGLIVEWIGGGARLTVRQAVVQHRVHVIASLVDMPPDDIRWEIVEGVGHIRSALDKMLVAIVLSNGNGASGVGFPFGGLGANGKPEPFPSRRDEVKLKNRLTSDQWDLVVSQKSYPGGNDILWSINELANEDKHRKDLVRVRVSLEPQAMTIAHGIFVGGRGGITFGGDPDYTDYNPENEALLISYPFGPGSRQPRIEHELMAQITFGEVRGVAGFEVTDTLRNQIAEVKRIVKSFETAFG